MREETRAAYEVWFRAAGIVLVATALVALLSGFYSKKFHLETGRAEWIWIEHPLDEKVPIAFFAIRDVLVPPDPPFVRLRIACDADWTAWLNGREIAGGAASSEVQIRELDLSSIARKGETNRFVVAIRSATGVGGFLASIDYAPLRENDVVTDDSWRVCRAWSPDLLSGRSGCDERPVLLGSPPFGRWNYPDTVPGTLPAEAPAEPVGPRSVAKTEIPRREIRVISGVAIESSTIVPATLFDFGPVEARGRVALPFPTTDVKVVEVRYASDTGELGSPGRNVEFVFAPGETTVTDSLARDFRFMAVADADASASAIPSSAP